MGKKEQRKQKGGSERGGSQKEGSQIEGSPLVGAGPGRGLRKLSEAMTSAFSYLLFEKEKRTNAPHPKHDFVKIIQLNSTEEHHSPHLSRYYHHYMLIIIVR